MENINISSFDPLIKPNVLRVTFPSTARISNLVLNTRKEVSEIISGKSKKKLFIVGPCSIHNIDQAFEYGKKLKIIADFVKDEILIIMRVYFEKPRTTIGWKGLINDPDMNSSFNVNKGLHHARKLLVNLNSIGMPCGYEVLDTITPQYISDLISWGAIGARTTESQVHRQMVSGLSFPVGFKNGTSGDKVIARDAVLSASFAHCFMGITNNGKPAICKTIGNINCHVILRGGKIGPNYSTGNIKEMNNLLREKNLECGIMVDCSHGNSNKDYRNQTKVLDSVLLQMKYDLTNIIGVMLESNLKEGKQKLISGREKFLEYGVSITDSCIGIEETESIIKRAFNELAGTPRLPLARRGGDTPPTLALRGILL
jgi:3-deoxy-7-phosphoheptulonate synthase